MDVLTLRAGQELEIRRKSERAVCHAWKKALWARLPALAAGIGSGLAGGTACFQAREHHLGRENWVTRESSTDAQPEGKGALAASQAACHQLTVGLQAGVLATLGQSLRLSWEPAKPNGP